MPKMSDSTLRALLASQHTDAMAGSNESKLSAARSDAMAYYNGDMTKDMPSAPGRSSAVSMDVSDTIEGIMPQLMEVFAGTDEVVKFEPVGPEDVQAAEQETDYINHVFMNQNPGFLSLYSFIKDALLSKVGIVKVWWETEEREQRETYYDKTEDEYALIVANPDVEVVEHSEHEAEEPDMVLGQHSGDLPGGNSPQPPIAGLAANTIPGAGPSQPKQSILHDVTVVTKKTHAQARVMGVPPEEFGIERGARNIRDCNYCFHKVVDRTESDLIEQGYDEKQVRALPTYRAVTTTEEITRDTVDEHSNASSSEVNSGARLVETTEHYSRIDYDGNGKVSLYRIVTGGNQGEILKRDGKPDIEPFDAIPFAAMTPVIVTHRFYGKSLADLVMDIQRIKTALIRGGLDSIYIALNPRVVVSEQGASDNTLDDLLVSRPNQIVRVKGDASTSIAYQTSPDTSKTVYPALEYMDQRLETRTGFSKRGQGIDSDALSNQSATASKIIENASQARVRLIARIFAETGIKDLFWLLHATIKKHGQQAAVVRLKNNWVNVDPREWKSRDDLTVHVGLGSSGRSQQLIETQLLIAAQEKGIAAGIVSKRNLFSSAKKLTRALGEADVETYFVDPSKPPSQNDPASAPLPPPPDPKMAAIEAQAQLDAKADQRKAQIETVQAQADMATDNAKTQAEIALQREKFALESRLAILEHQMQSEREIREHQLKMAQLTAKTDADRESHQMKMEQGHMKMAQTSQAHETKMAQVESAPA